MSGLNLVSQVAPPAEEGRTFQFNRRIASVSFDPSLRRSKQSLRGSQSSMSSRLSRVSQVLRASVASRPSAFAQDAHVRGSIASRASGFAAADAAVNDEAESDEASNVEENAVAMEDDVEEKIMSD